jgi:hypothetical protein
MMRQDAAYEARFQAARDALASMPADTRAMVLRHMDRLDKLYCRSGSAAYSATVELIQSRGLHRPNDLFQHDREALVRMFGGTVTSDRAAA